MTLKLIICLILLIPISSTIDNKITNLKKNSEVSTNLDILHELDCIGNKCLNVLESFTLNNGTRNIEGRKRKKMKLNKYLFPLIIGFFLIKSVILPMALKALAILSGKAVVLSLMSLILAAIIGLRTIANGASSAQNKIDLDNMIKYKRKDNMDYYTVPPIDEHPYQFFPDNHQRNMQ